MKIQDQSNSALKNLIATGHLPFKSLESLSNIALSQNLIDAAYAKKVSYYRDQVTYSPKVFIPLTFLCRDVCHYCTFAQTPKKVKSPYLSIEEVISLAKDGEAHGCHEALFTLGDKPE
nr:7,8-didemethyl-8-hydroxy-5-deazariboflavin synthase [SAR86 cluster bacterium]